MNLFAVFSCVKDRRDNGLRPDDVVDYDIQKNGHFYDQVRSRVLVVMNEPFMHGVVSDKTNRMCRPDDMVRHSEVRNHIGKPSLEPLFFAKPLEAQAQQSCRGRRRNERYLLGFGKGLPHGIRHVLGRHDGEWFRPNKFSVVPDRRLFAPVARPDLKSLRVDELKEVVWGRFDSVDSAIGVNVHRPFVFAWNDVPREMAKPAAMRARIAV